MYSVENNKCTRRYNRMLKTNFRKSFLVGFASLMLCGNIFAASSGFGSLMKSLNSLDGSKVEPVVVETVEGRDLFPIIWKMTHEELPVEGKVVGAKNTLNYANVIENEYEVITYVYFKNGLGLSCEETQLQIKADKTNISVLTVSMYTYNVNKQAERTGDKLENQKSSMNKKATTVADGLLNSLKNISDDEYQKWFYAAYYNLDTQIAVSSYAANKLKAKKWYEKYSLEGKEISIKFLFADIKESKSGTYSYELGGLYGSYQPVLVTVYTNNDEYIDVATDSSITINGVVKNITYSGDYDTDYRIKSITIEEK